MTSNADPSKDRLAYPLNRDLMASSRLHMQHQVWISSVGYHLNPSIPLTPNSLIAEIACGTGIWSLELAKQLPPEGSAKIEASDLSLAQCPPRAWWPANVTFSELDIFEPKIPEQLLSRYDVVHLRHFICVIRSGDPLPLLSALLKLLKPGGYLQWQEWDISTNVVVLADPEREAPKMRALVESTRGPEKFQEQTSWVAKFHERFPCAGAELVAHDRHRTAREAMMISQETGFLSAREWCGNLRARDPEDPEAARMEELVREAEEECVRLGRGTMVDNEMVTWVLRKV